MDPSPGPSTHRPNSELTRGAPALRGTGAAARLVNRDVYTLWCNDGSFQKWIVINRGFGTIILRNLATGVVLDSNAWGDVYTLGENGGSYQKWIAASA